MKSRHSDLGLLILRVGFSALMLTHGYGKFMMLIQGNGDQFGQVLGLPAIVACILAVIGEFIAPILIILGVKTRLSTIPVIIVMAVAAFVVHAADPIATKEKALLYLIAFVVIGLSGPGKYSIDGRKGY
ncbi:DoxX family protein [Sungkyunkwania multivorans]|uniref:DoxX family protein n=1 Tax=Sungkyunkwania multivorans TaxID=1173618 RepID=A0ABW3CYR1_9FLAO